MEINIDRIQDEMKNREQWLCWEAAIRDGKETKLPKDPNTGDFAQTDDPSTWGSFLNANGKVKTGQMDGVGFVFTEDDNYLGIDLDNCRDPDTGEWDDWALDVMGDIGGWIEISPSGTGAHIIIKGEIPGSRNRKGDLEMYEDGRFFTVTGQLVDETGEPLDEDDETPEIKEAQKALNAVYDRFLAEEDSADGTEVDVDPDKWGHLDLEDHDGQLRSSHSTGAALDDLPAELREIIKSAKSANNGYQFAQLWRGNWKSEGYESHSEGDMAFCDMLAFWFSGDPERMDRVFRASGLMRPKWDDVRYSDGSTYGERTIEKAIAEVDDYYDEEYYYNHVEQNGGTDDDDDGDGGRGKENRRREARASKNGDGSSSVVSWSETTDGDGSPSSGAPDTSEIASRAGSSAASDRSANNGESSNGGTQGGSRDRQAGSGQTNTQRRGRERGRGKGKKRSQKRRDGIPDDITKSSTGGSQRPKSGSNSLSRESSTNSSGEPSGKAVRDRETAPSPGPDSDALDDLNDSVHSGSEQPDPASGSGDGDASDNENGDDELLSESEAESIFDGAEEEFASGSDTDSDSSDGRGTASSTDVGEGSEPAERDDSSRGDSRRSSSSGDTDDQDGDEPEQDDGEPEDAVERLDKIEKRLDEFEEETGEDLETVKRELLQVKEDLDEAQTELEDAQQTLFQVDEELGTAKAELRHDLELEDDKLERVYSELQKYEKIVDKRENQLETMYQLLALLCHVQPEPLFNKVENVLLNTGGIPPENIFSESVEDIINHYYDEPPSVEPESSSSHADTSTAQSHPDRPSPDRSANTSRQSSTQAHRGERRDAVPEGADVDADEDGDRDDDDSFLSAFF